MVNNLGMFSLDDYISLPVQLNDYVTGARDPDDGNVTVNFYYHLPSSASALAAMTLSATFGNKIDSKTGFYAYNFQATAANGFAKGGQYFARLTALIGGIRPATLYTFRIAYSKMMVYTGGSWAQVG